MNASCKYVQYKVNVSENQVTTLKDAIRLKKGDRVMLLTPAQIRMSARQVAKNVSYTGGFLGMLPSLAARSIPLADRALPTILTGLTTGLLSVVPRFSKMLFLNVWKDRQLKPFRYVTYDKF